eukprot:14029486-Heterocapsa_arctica.AAC.1
MIDLKGLARPEKFDGMDKHWLEWKDSFRSVMNLLEVTRDAIERMNLTDIELERCTLREQYLRHLLYTVLINWFVAERTRSVFQLVPNANKFERWRR